MERHPAAIMKSLHVSRDQVRDEGFTVLADPESPVVDIVFCHGLGGHPFDTWACRRNDTALANKRPSADLEVPVSEYGSGPSGKRQRFLSRFRSLGVGSKSSDNTPQSQSDTWQTDTSPASQKTDNDQNRVTYWIKDFLAEEKGLEHARILVYGYDSKVAKVYKSVDRSSLFTHARKLLYSLARKKPSGRSVIFVAHSLGGLLVKEVLRRSEESEEEEIQDIVRCTKGVIFLGTPHQGSPGMADFGQSVRAMASVILRVDTNDTILRALGTDSPELELGRESFIKLWRKYDFRVKTFQEARGMLGVNIGILNNKVVPDNSSKLDDPREHAEPMSSNHMEMCRFRKSTDNDYENLAAEIKAFVLAASRSMFLALPFTTLAARERCSPPWAPWPNTYGASMNIATDAQVCPEFIDSLAFPGMKDRLRGIKRPLDTTCQWLYSTPEYIAWMQRQNIHENLGLLWIKGKPGSGKSTLMKDALHNTADMLSHSETTTAGFFFNARSGQKLDKTPLGLYQSLLHQVLIQDTPAVHRLTPGYTRRMEQKPNVKWHEEELQDLLEQVFATQSSRPTFLFIDALDECNDDEVRHLVRFFKRLVKKAVAAGARLNVCLSSRHYPHISIKQCPEVVVEDNNGADILLYVETEAEDNRPIADIKKDIVAKSSGIFLWVVLVVAILQKHGRGKSLIWLREKLREIPEELDTLFRTLFCQNDSDDDAERARSQTICLMQLILFSEQPMKLTQINVALAFGRNALDSLQTWKDSIEYLETPEQIKELILDLSRGLLEEKPMEVEPTYQFIHETVREFFLSGLGFQLLEFSPDSVAGSGHLMFASCCVNYLATSECETIARGPNAEKAACGPDFDLLDYVSCHLFDHIEAAIQQGAPDEELRRVIHRFSDNSCQLLRHLFSMRKVHMLLPGSTILMAAVQYGALESARYILDMGFDINEPSPTAQRYALHTALSKFWTRNWESNFEKDDGLSMVNLLLSHNASVHLRNFFGQTPLHIAAATTEDIVAKLLTRHPPVNEKDNDGETPLDRVGWTTEGDNIARLLMQHGATREASRLCASPTRIYAGKVGGEERLPH